MATCLKNKKFWKQLLTVFICTVLFLLPGLIKNHGILVFPGDAYEQYLQVYMGGWEKVHSTGLSMFDWSSGLGANEFMYSNWYFMSPYFWLMTPFPKTWIPYEMTVITILKFMICYVFAHLWSSKLTKNEDHRFLMSSMVTFSGWVFFFQTYCNFFDGYVMLVWILYFAECFLQDHDFKGLVIGYFLLTLQTYYFSYMYVLFICLYGLLRFLVLNENAKFTGVLICALKYLGSILLGIGMACCVLMPTIYTVIGNPRLSKTVIPFVTGKYDLFRILSSMFIPVTSRLDGNYLISRNLADNLGWGGGCSLYSFVIAPFVIISLFSLFKKREARYLLGAYGVLFDFMFFPPLWYLVQSTLDTRWFFAFVFLNAYASSFVLGHLDDLNRKQLTLTLVASLSLVLATFGISYLKHLYEPANVRSLVCLLATQLFMYVLYYFVLVNKKRMISLLVCLEILLAGFSFVAHNDQVHYGLFANISEKGTMVQTLKERDLEFWRMAYDGDNIVTPNEPFGLNYPGLSFYFSLYNFEQEDYLSRYKGSWSMPIVNGRNLAYNQLATRYWYTQFYSNFPPYGYDYYENIAGYEVYKNRYGSPLAYYMDQTISADFVKTLSYFEQDRIMDYYLVTETSENTSYSYEPFRKVGTYSCEMANSHFLSEDLQQKIIYILPKDLKSEFMVDYYRGGELLYSKHYYQIGYFDFYTNYSGIDEIVVSFVDEEGTYDFCVQDDLAEFDRLYETRCSNSLTDIVVTNDKVTMRSNSDQVHHVYTSIAYDKGWTLKIDGQKTDYYKANFGFIGFDLEAGEHEIVLTYRSPLFYEGCCVSLTSLALFVYLCRKETCYESVNEK